MAINPWFQNKLSALHSPLTLNILLEVVPGNDAGALLAHLQKLPGVKYTGQAFNYYEFTVPTALASEIAALPGVIVHYNAPVKLSASPLYVDPILGSVHISSVTVPFSPKDIPAHIAAISVRAALSGKLHDPSVIITSNADARNLLQPPDNQSGGVHVEHGKIAFLDTGIGYPHPAFKLTGIAKDRPHMASVGGFAGVSPFDGLGHGMWCASAATGWPAWTRFGRFNGVANVDPHNVASFKCLNDLGFGSTGGILKGLEAAIKWGADVVSMSLGGTLQGGVRDDPVCKIIEQYKESILFVCAAGNDGPDSWSINSPGASPYAITVGAYSPYYQALAPFSSRGPSGKYYSDHPDIWAQDLAIYGDRLIKPDLLAPGGGGTAPGKASDPTQPKPEVIISGGVGWTQPMYVGLPDAWGAMRGTSQATPMAAGLLLLAVERGLVVTGDDVRRAMAVGGSKLGNPGAGYGLITWPRLNSGGRSSNLQANSQTQDPVTQPVVVGAAGLDPLLLTESERRKIDDLFGGWS